MKPWNLLLLVAVWSFLAADVSAAPAHDEITQLDATAGTLAISNGKGEFKTYRTKATTEVLLNNCKAALTNLTAGMTAVVTTAESGVAVRIVATSGASGAAPTSKVAPPSSRVRVAANAWEQDPVVVGRVSAGQRVTITPVKVWWSGGGSKRGKFCDWQGYTGTRVNHGKSWMALIARVGDAFYGAENNTFSFTVPAEGTLVLFPNDLKAEDNEGSGSVQVTISAN